MHVAVLPQSGAVEDLVGRVGMLAPQESTLTN